MEKISLEEYKSKYGADAGTTFKHPQSRSTFFERSGDVIKKRGRLVRQAIEGEGQFEGRSPVRRGFEATAQAFGAPTEVAFQAAPEVVREGAGFAGEKIGQGFSKLTGLIGSNKALQRWVIEHPEAARMVEEAAGTTAAAGQIAGSILTAEATAKGLQAGADASKRAAQKAIHTTDDLIHKAPEVLGPKVEKAKQLISPQKDVKGAVQEIIKGKTQKDVELGTKALQSIKTEGVKTFDDLSRKLDDAIPEYAKVVDDALAQDPTKTVLDDLVSYRDVSSGSTVSTNYVKKSLDHLKELYDKTDDIVMAKEMDDLIFRANNEGLTKLDINNISRMYNREFGSKAFSKVSGDPLTSVNAQMYENVRRGLKTKAREGIGGEAARQADDVMHSIYNTQNLVNKNASAAMLFKARIAERGLLEKIGHSATKYLDVLTGGTLRGLVGGILPRGKGYKVFNIVDLEQRLQDNLNIINQGVNAADDAAMVAAAQQLSAQSTAPISTSP